MMFDPSGCRIENIDTRTVVPAICGVRSHPDSTALIDEQASCGIARERACLCGIVAVDRKAIGGSIPTREPGVFDGNPKIVMGVFNYGLDETARQSILDGRRVGVAKQLVAVVANQSIFGAQPDEPLRVLQHDVNRALGQPVGGCEMLESDGRRFSGRLGGRRAQNP